VWQEKISEPKLWSLKDKIKLQDTGKQIEPRIMEIRHRRQQHLQNVAERARRHNRAEMTRRGSEIFSCHTFSLFDVIFLVSVFLVSESFLVSPKIDFGRFTVINFLFKSAASYHLGFEFFFKC
jgi:hypothetical protein